MMMPSQSWYMQQLRAAGNEGLLAPASMAPATSWRWAPALPRSPKNPLQGQTSKQIMGQWDKKTKDTIKNNRDSRSSAYDMIDVQVCYCFTRVKSWWKWSTILGTTSEAPKYLILFLAPCLLAQIITSNPPDQLSQWDSLFLPGSENEVSLGD